MDEVLFIVRNNVLFGNTFFGEPIHAAQINLKVAYPGIENFKNKSVEVPKTTQPIEQASLRTFHIHRAVKTPLMRSF